MRIRSFVLSGAGLLAGSLALLLWIWINAPLAGVKLWNFFPSNLESPPVVPIHIFPLMSCLMSVIDDCTRPLCVV